MARKLPPGESFLSPVLLIHAHSRDYQTTGKRLIEIFNQIHGYQGVVGRKDRPAVKMGSR